MKKARRSERGSVTILALVIVMMAGFVMVGVARSGSAAGRAARADIAADSAAIAAAVSLARMEGSTAAWAGAQQAASANGGILERCDCSGDHAEVVVTVDGATGRARAEVNLACAIAGTACEPRGRVGGRIDPELIGAGSRRGPRLLRSSDASRRHRDLGSGSRRCGVFGL